MANSTKASKTSAVIFFRSFIVFFAYKINQFYILIVRPGMKGVKINTLLASPHILVAPLDWGLGHATRCIPLIHLLLNQGCRITIAASGPGITLLKKELPQVNIVSIPGYGINYSKTPGMFLPKLLLQFPRIASAIKRENRWLKNFIKENGIQAVISDNRMGMHCTGTPSAYITHQLQIETGYALSLIHI